MPQPAATDTGRVVDAYCDRCMDVKPHEVVAAGACKCRGCGRVGPMVAPEGKVAADAGRPVR